MSVLACVGCRLAASTRQSRMEFYRCCGNEWLLSTKKKKKKNIFTPTQSQTLTVVVGPKVARHISLWGVGREHRRDLAGLPVRKRCNERRHSNLTHTHTSPGNASKNTLCCAAWCMLGWTVAVMSQCARLGTCRVKCVCGVLVFWLSDPDIVSGIWLYF